MQPELGQALHAIKGIMTITGTPGVSIGIIHHGQTAGTYHFGYRDVQNKVQANDDTRYNINSLSKSLVSSLVGMEVHRGGLDWFEPIKIWLPGFSSGNHELEENCSIVDLLSHRAGLSSLNDFWMGADNETNIQFSSGSDASNFSPLKNCRMLTTNHSRLPGASWREQGYALGWSRSQLPGRLRLLSGNALFGDGLIVGKGNSLLVFWHHGCMPGSASVVYLAPKVESGVVVLQNSMPVIDTADFIGQLVLEAVLHVEEPNDYVELSKKLYDKGVNHLENFQKELG